MLLRNGLSAACIALVLTVTCFGAANTDRNTAEIRVAAIADLDGDHNADFVFGSRIDGSISGSVYSINVGLSTQKQLSSFTVSDPDGMGLTITAVDLDGDHDLDLVITSRAAGRPVGAWINDGRGGFQSGDLRQFSDSALFGTRSVRQVQVLSLDEPLESKKQRILQFVVGVRLQEPRTGYRTHASSSLAILPQLYLEFPPALRAPPLSL